MARGHQNTRFDLYYLLYNQSLAGQPGVEGAIKWNVEKSEYFIYENELDKFAEAHPDVDVVAFKTFLTKYNAFKTKGKASTGEGRVSIASPKKAEALGLSPENQKIFIDKMTQIKKLATEVGGILPETHTIGVYVKKITVKEEKTAEVSAAQSS